MSVTIETATPRDYTEILALNDRSIPHVNRIDRNALNELHGWAESFRVARLEQNVIGLLIALPPECAYQSLNYRWFERHYERFVYIDRIIVDATQHGAGVAQALYRDLTARVADRFESLACEVNVRPENPKSLRFHAKLGFEEVGQQDTEGGAKRVSLLMRPLTVPLP